MRWACHGSPFPALNISPLLLFLLVMFAFGVATTPSPDTAWVRVSHLLAGVLVLITLADRADNITHLVAGLAILVALAAVFAVGAPFATAWSGSQGINLSALTARYVPLLARPSNVNNVSGALAAAEPVAVALMAI